MKVPQTHWAQTHWQWVPTFKEAVPPPPPGGIPFTLLSSLYFPIICTEW